MRKDLLTVKEDLRLFRDDEQAAEPAEKGRPADVAGLQRSRPVSAWL